MRVVTWNGWGLYGRQEREAAIAAALRNARADIVVLTESGAKGADSQCTRLAEPLGMPHHAFSGVEAQEDATAICGVAVMSRWLISASASRALGDAREQYAQVSGPVGRSSVR